jgi:hypothetical protein
MATCTALQGSAFTAHYVRRADEQSMFEYAVLSHGEGVVHRD